MDSFLPSTVKQWLNLPDHINRNASRHSSLSSFKSLLNSYFCRKSNDFLNFGTRKYNILSIEEQCKYLNSWQIYIPVIKV